jgi:hypothetical protein
MQGLRHTCEMIQAKGQCNTGKVMYLSDLEVKWKDTWFDGAVLAKPRIENDGENGLGASRNIDGNSPYPLQISLTVVTSSIEPWLHVSTPII